jgi:predicted metal-dependent phosphoesterase TrpH
MLIDMHIHTNSYSACSLLDPVEIVRRAEEVGLSGVVLSSPTGHVLVYGCYDTMDYLSVGKLLERVHAEGGVALPSHPFRYGDYAVDSLEILKEQLSGYDGFEALNGNQNDYQNEFGIGAWEALGITGIGGSDAHSLDMVGTYVTEFQNTVQDENDLAAEIRAGRCRPVVRHGFVEINNVGS